MEDSLNQLLSANLTVEQRQLMRELRDYLYKIYFSQQPFYEMLRIGQEDPIKTRTLLGRLNYQLGISIPAGTEVYEAVFVYPDGTTISATIRNTNMNTEMSADAFLWLLRGVSPVKHKLDMEEHP